jgi:hypothetical protein
VETSSVHQVVVGRIAAVEAEASEGIKGAAGRADIQATAEVEVLPGRAGRVGIAGTVDEDISCDAKGASSSDSIVASTRKPIRSNGLSATLEGGVEISEARIIRAGICIAVESNSCLEKGSI